MAKRDTQFINNFLILKPSMGGHIKLHTSECIRFFSPSKMHNFWPSIIDLRVHTGAPTAKNSGISLYHDCLCNWKVKRITKSQLIA